MLFILSLSHFALKPDFSSIKVAKDFIRRFQKSVAARFLHEIQARTIFKPPLAEAHNRCAAICTRQLAYPPRLEFESA
jgi:hypothetical protein